MRSFPFSCHSERRRREESAFQKQILRFAQDDKANLPRRFLLVAAALLFLLWAPPARAATEIKFASLAPEGTTWMEVMRALDQDVRQATGGAVRFRIYPGGVSGNEKDVVRKLRVGQLHAAGFTGVGLGEILPAVRLLELPFLFRDYAEVDKVHRELAPWFEKAFGEKGYVLLGWSEVGFAHFFSQAPVRSRAGLLRQKVWMWEGDPLARAYFEALGVQPIPLNVTDVLTSLQTGLIDTVYASPLGAVALQWFTKVRYMSPVPMVNVTGAIVVRKDVFQRLSPAHQRVLLEKTRARMEELQRLTRAENERAVEAMRKRGLELAPEPSPAEMEELRRIGREAERKLAGALIPPDLLARARQALAAPR
ncbi:MAG: TRAP transporter substrate-binding protein DctP [Nitrospinota bacterium]